MADSAAFDQSSDRERQRTAVFATRHLGDRTMEDMEALYEDLFAQVDTPALCWPRHRSAPSQPQVAIGWPSVRAKTWIPNMNRFVAFRINTVNPAYLVDPNATQASTLHIAIKHLKMAQHGIELEKGYLQNMTNTLKMFATHGPLSTSGRPKVVIGQKEIAACMQKALFVKFC
ncbi:hypothetical protein BC940DRAFT_336147 [Gongronella butleri]|nr:hypothetical protein BC940DRAFT_336147 [Gongronella butleri]